MSLTQGETVFAGVDETGLNDLLRAVFSARPRYLNYGTPFFVPTDSVSATAIPAIAFPNVQAGLEFAISISIPEVDIYPDSHAGTWTLTPGPGQFAIKTRVSLSTVCRNAGDQRQTSAELDIYALCRPQAVKNSAGATEVGIAVDRVEIETIEPAALESVVECLLLEVLRAALGSVRLPVDSLDLGAFVIALVAGPTAENNQVTVRGTAL